MKITLAILAAASIFLSACNSSSGGGSGSGGGGPDTLGNDEPIPNNGSVEEWQVASIGQEGHGGDAVVCFNIPVSRALKKIDLRKKSTCVPTNEKPCVEAVKNEPIGSGHKAPPEVLWQMTSEGRRNIKSAKPLEQYLAEKIPGKYEFINNILNHVSVEDGFSSLLGSLDGIPAAYEGLEATRRKIGWLKTEGVASEFGLADINDSGFVNESDIDTNFCKELQAVVRRGNQLWYDKDIISHFSNAGLTLMQAHEVFYTWGKEFDKINGHRNMPAHETSENTRRFILKLVYGETDPLPQHLKNYGFGINYWGKRTAFPTSLGYFMTGTQCQSEQSNLRKIINSLPKNDSFKFWISLENYFSSNYLKTDNTDTFLEIKENYPKAFNDLISYVYSSSANTPNLEYNVERYLQKVERPGTCVGSK